MKQFKTFVFELRIVQALYSQVYNYFLNQENCCSTLNLKFKNQITTVD
jgi:hypothetical protein